MVCYFSDGMHERGVLAIKKKLLTDSYQLASADSLLF